MKAINKISKKNEIFLKEFFDNAMIDYKNYLKSKFEFINQGTNDFLKTRKYNNNLVLYFYIKSLGNKFDYLYFKEKNKNNPKIKEFKTKSQRNIILSAVMENVPILLFSLTGSTFISTINGDYGIYASIWILLVIVSFFIYSRHYEKKFIEKAYDDLRNLCEKPKGKWA